MLCQQASPLSSLAPWMLVFSLPVALFSGCFIPENPRLISTYGVHTTKDREHDRGSGWSVGLGLQERDKGMNYGCILEYVQSEYDTADISRIEFEGVFAFGPAYFEWGIGRHRSSEDESGVGFASGVGLVAGWDGNVRYKAGLYLESYLWVGERNGLDARGAEISVELQGGFWF